MEEKCEYNETHRCWVPPKHCRGRDGCKMIGIFERQDGKLEGKTDATSVCCVLPPRCYRPKYEQQNVGGVQR